MFFKRDLFFNELNYQYEETFTTDYKLITLLKTLITMEFPYATQEGTSRFAFMLNDERFSPHETALIESLVHNDLLFFKDKQLHLLARSHFSSIISQEREDDTHPSDKNTKHLVSLKSSDFNMVLDSLFQGKSEAIRLYVANLSLSRDYNFHRDFRLERITSEPVTLHAPTLDRRLFRTAIDLGVTRFDVAPYIEHDVRQIAFYGRCLNGEVLLGIILSEDVHGFIE